MTDMLIPEAKEFYPIKDNYSNEEMLHIIEDITNQDTGVYDASQKNDGVVLGASSDITSNDIESKSDNNTNKADSIYNKGIDILAFSIKHWLWTLGGIILLFLIIKIKRRRKE